MAPFKNKIPLGKEKKNSSHDKKIVKGFGNEARLEHQLAVLHLLYT